MLSYILCTIVCNTYKEEKEKKGDQDVGGGGL